MTENTTDRCKYTQEELNEMYMGATLTFNAAVAKECGLHCAILFNHILYWIRINASKGVNFINGKTWMYETQQDMVNFLNFMSIDEVKKAMAKLLDSGLLIKECHNPNPFDRTGWYTTNTQNISQIKKSVTEVPIGTLGVANRHGEKVPDGTSRKCQTAPCNIGKEEQQEEEIYKQQQSIRTEQDAPVVEQAAPAVVVVSKPLVSGKEEKANHTKLTKDDVFANAVRLKKDWKPEEIEEAWSRFVSSNMQITNPLKYIDGIIAKMRVNNSSKQIKSKQGETKCDHLEIQNQKRSELRNAKDNYLEKDTLVPALEKFVLPPIPKKQ